jgi:hypothetical protein
MIPADWNEVIDAQKQALRNGRSNARAGKANL